MALGNATMVLAPDALAARGRTTLLLTPPIARVVPDGVFDAYAWAEPQWLFWHHDGEFDRELPTSDNPPGAVFLLDTRVIELPSEPAELHVPAIVRTGTRCLAPWGIDAATDGLFAQRIPPSSCLALATSSLAGLFWGLHDWFHFHHHGSLFDAAWTELQCDRAAFAWTALNASAIGLDARQLEMLARRVRALGEARFEQTLGAIPHAARHRLAELETRARAPLSRARCFLR